MTACNSLCFLTLLTLAAPACDTDGDTSDTSSGSESSTSSAATGSTGEPTTDSTTDSTTGGAIADCGFDPGVTFSPLALVYQLESKDGATCVRLKRRDDSEPGKIYKAFPYTLLEWTSGHAGVVTQVTDPAALTWESTHHNWTDAATANDGSVRLRLEDWSWDGDLLDKFGLYAYDANTDKLLWGPITLFPASLEGGGQ